MTRQLNGISRSLLLSSLALTTWASECVADAEPEPEFPRVATANVFGISIAYQVPLDLDKDWALGSGLTYTRDYFVSRRTALGIHAGVRIFPAAPWHLAFGYGLSIKHYVGPTRIEQTATGLYLLYGLQAQLNVLEGRAGTATDHDTRLAVGYDFRAGSLIPVFETGYHITQLRNFDSETIWWPYIEVVFGLRFE